MTENQLLRDANIEPSSEVIAEGLGLANDAYIGFLKECANHSIELNWRYYNDGKAWLGKGLYKWQTSRGTQKEITAFWLSVWEGFFKVSVFIPEKHRAEVLNLPLSAEMKKKIEDAKRMGKLKFFPLIFDLSSKDVFGELFILIDFRKSSK